MKKQSELVDNFCIDIQKTTQEIIKLSQNVGTGKTYQELLSYKEFNQAISNSTEGIKNVLQKMNKIHPKLSMKLTENEKVRPSDNDVITHVVDFLLEAIEVEEVVQIQSKQQQKENHVTITKPQIYFTEKPDNFSSHYKPILKKKYHSQFINYTDNPLLLFKPNKSKEDAIEKIENDPSLDEKEKERKKLQQNHPLYNEIKDVKQMKWQKEKVTPEAPLSYEDTPLVFVDTLEELQKMIVSLNNVNQFAIDVEHHSEHSYYGFVCLVQISTRSTDYIIDTLKLRDHMHLLNEPFTNPEIEKVFHGCDYDIVWLSYNFGVYVVNCIDSGQCARALKLPHFSYKYLMEKYVNIEIDKKYQLADWRIRPLPQEMINYARGDTHYLLYIIDQMRNECIDMHCLDEVLTKSNELCLRLFKPTVINDDLIERMSRKHLIRQDQMEIFKSVYLLRDHIARLEDESPGSIMTNAMMINLINDLPTTQEELKSCCLPRIPYFVQMHSQEILNLTKAERERRNLINDETNQNDITLSETVKFVQRNIGDDYHGTIISKVKTFEDFI